MIYLEKDFTQTVFISYFFGKIYHTQINLTLSTKYCSFQVKPSDFWNGFCLPHGMPHFLLLLLLLLGTFVSEVFYYFSSLFMKFPIPFQYILLNFCIFIYQFFIHTLTSQILKKNIGNFTFFLENFKNSKIWKN